MADPHDSLPAAAAAPPSPCAREQDVIALAFGALDDPARIAGARAHVAACDACLVLLADAKRSAWRDARRARPENADVQEAAAAALLAALLAGAVRRARHRPLHGAAGVVEEATHPLAVDPPQLAAQIVGQPYVDSAGTIHLQLRSDDWTPAHRRLLHVRVAGRRVHAFGVPSSHGVGDWDVLFRLAEVPPERVADLELDPKTFSLELQST